MKKSILLAGVMAFGLSAYAMAADTTGTVDTTAAAGNSGASQMGSGDSTGGMVGRDSQYPTGGAAATNEPPLPDDGSTASARPNTDYGTLEPGTADTRAGVSQPSTTRAADSTETRAPLAGANSFTEAEATRRLQGAGYTQISGLAKDDQSVWRGTAMKGSQQVTVALDYRGRVTDTAK